MEGLSAEGRYQHSVLHAGGSNRDGALTMSAEKSRSLAARSDTPAMNKCEALSILVMDC